MGYRKSDCEKYFISDAHHSGPISTTTNGFYFEMLVYNNTGFPIGIVDKHNGKHKVANIKGVGRNDVVTVIYRRAINVSRKQHSQDIPIPTVTIEIPYSILLNEPVYVKEVDLLFCNEGSLDGFNHPHKAAGLDEILDEYFKKIQNGLKVPTIKVYGNDTTGKIKNASMYIFNSFCNVSFTKWENSEDCVTIVFPDQKGNHSHYKIPLDTVIKSDGKLTVQTKDGNFDLYLALERNTIKTYLEKEEREKSSLEEILKEEKFKLVEENKKYKKKIEDSVREEFRTKTVELEKEIQDLKEANEKKIKDLQTIIELQNITIEAKRIQAKEEKEEFDRDEAKKDRKSSEKTRKKKEYSSSLDKWFTILKIVASVTLAVIGYFAGKKTKFA